MVSPPPPRLEAIGELVLRAARAGVVKGAVIVGRAGTGKTRLGVWLSAELAWPTQWLSTQSLKYRSPLVIVDVELLNGRERAIWLREVDRTRAFTLVLSREDVRLSSRFGLRLEISALDETARSAILPPNLLSASRGYTLAECECLAAGRVPVRTALEGTWLRDFPEVGRVGNPETLYALREAVVVRGEHCVCYGPTGSGKTLALRWVAREAHAAGLEVLELNVFELLRPKLGATEKAIAAAFRTARQTRCVVLMDNLEVIGAPRGNDTTVEGSLDRAVGTLLVEMCDGDFVVVAAVPRLGALDEALLRPGRLGTRLSFRVPPPP
ncbi:hypothetical protein CTAYLR_010733 [Chrysophaeum taylorii]|uniref:AAA+ ATPase domain-containing protein n=1 Tax=Chrysophaeum taylorii TaxID=2483200 RepID=A0AAD7UA50_9STRA|nr:hypothetical protein CTAYLR_010733 [Chrysophaeum taylorii]